MASPWNADRMIQIQKQKGNCHMILIKRVHVFAPQDMGMKDVLVGGTKILKIGENLPAEEA